MSGFIRQIGHDNFENYNRSPQFRTAWDYAMFHCLYNES